MTWELILDGYSESSYSATPRFAAARLPWFKETPEQRFSLEQEHLQPLPDTDFDTSYFDIRHVSW
ncbi:hypothetical protein, partial [Escherichia coli]|uniref:hypothetical protein n=1 Tax=Escherichia coli TaxID=562 RepID=UPI001E4F31D9